MRIIFYITYITMKTAIVIVVIIILIWLLTAYDRKLYGIRKFPTETIDEAASSMSPGDLIFTIWDYMAPYSGGGNFRSLMDYMMFNRLYTTVTNTPYTHIAMCVQDPNTGAKYIYDNYPDHRKDEFTGSAKNGPALIEPSEFIKAYSGDVIHIPLVKGVAFDVDKTWSFVKSDISHKYDDSIINKINAVFKIPIRDIRNRKASTCAESVARVLGAHELYDRKPQTSNPSDIWKAARASGAYGEPVLLRK
jgi:hypothetical protein